MQLWQRKEWRVDRLREHLQAEGALRALWGYPRAAAGTLLLLIAWSLHGPAGRTAAVMGLSVWIFMGIAQGATRRLRLPVWTAKTIGIVALALAGNLIGIVTVNADTLARWYPVLLLAQPAFVGIAWVVLLPADRILKRAMLRRAARARRSVGNLTVVAVCGSVGKTTTKELLARALRPVLPVVTPAYVNSEVGVAQWFLREHAAGRVRPGGVVVVEMGGYRTGEVAMLCTVMRPTVGIVTSVGTQHIALYGSKEHILEAEREMPRALPPDGRLILNGDNPDCRSLAAAARCPVMTVGTHDVNDLRATDIESTDDGIAFRADGHDIRLAVHGTHNVSNALCAYAAARACGLAATDIVAGLRAPLGVSHTFHVSRRGGVLVLDDTHNASPESVAAACAWAAARPERPRVLLTTGLLEQGTHENAEMERFGTLARGTFDRVVFVGSRGRNAFARGYGRTTEPPPSALPIPAGGLCAAVGRVPARALATLLP